MNPKYTWKLVCIGGYTHLKSTFNSGNPSNFWPAMDPRWSNYILLRTYDCNGILDLGVCDLGTSPFRTPSPLSRAPSMWDFCWTWPAKPRKSWVTLQLVVATSKPWSHQEATAPLFKVQHPKLRSASLPISVGSRLTSPNQAVKDFEVLTSSTHHAMGKIMSF